MIEFAALILLMQARLVLTFEILRWLKYVSKVLINTLQKYWIKWCSFALRNKFHCFSVTVTTDCSKLSYEDFNVRLCKFIQWSSPMFDWVLSINLINASRLVLAFAILTLSMYKKSCLSPCKCLERNGKLFYTQE